MRAAEPNGLAVAPTGLSACVFLVLGMSGMSDADAEAGAHEFMERYASSVVTWESLAEVARWGREYMADVWVNG